MSEIVPDDFDLEDMLGARSSTPNDKRNRCPECHHLNISPHVHATFENAKYRCNVCGHHFDKPVQNVVSDGGE